MSFIQGIQTGGNRFISTLIAGNVSVLFTLGCLHYHTYQNFEWFYAAKQGLSDEPITWVFFFVLQWVLVPISIGGIIFRNGFLFLYAALAAWGFYMAAFNVPEVVLIFD